MAPMFHAARTPFHRPSDRRQRIFLGGGDFSGCLTAPAAAPIGRRWRRTRRTRPAPARAAWRLLHRGTDRAERGGDPGRYRGRERPEPGLWRPFFSLVARDNRADPRIFQFVPADYLALHPVCRPGPQTPGHGGPRADSGAPDGSHVVLHGLPKTLGVALQPQRRRPISSDGLVFAAR